MDDTLWARFDYFKLRETLETIVSAMEATAQADSPLSEPDTDGTLRLMVTNDPGKGEGSPSDEPAGHGRDSSD